MVVFELVLEIQPIIKLRRIIANINAMNRNVDKNRGQVIRSRSQELVLGYGWRNVFFSGMNDAINLDYVASTRWSNMNTSRDAINILRDKLSDHLISRNANMTIPSINMMRCNSIGLFGHVMGRLLTSKHSIFLNPGLFV